MRETESLRAAQQMLCNNAIHQLTNAIYIFRSVQHMDGRSEKGRSILAEDLMLIEDTLHSVHSQIETIRNLVLSQYFGHIFIDFFVQSPQRLASF